MHRSTRRAYLRAVGATTVAGLAGCGGGDGGSDLPTITADDDASLHEWLTRTTVGGTASNYEGTLVDRRGEDAVTIDVGANGNGGNFAYSPPALLVTTGTELRWSWTGKGTPHDVSAAPPVARDAPGYGLDSGDPEGGEGVKYRKTPAETGVGLYYCSVHIQQGMKGGFRVESA
ncbi:MAG: halocyanin domain-containing protein [Halobacteriaceae archaeon]